MLPSSRHSLFSLVPSLVLVASACAQVLGPHPIHLANGKTLTLNLPAPYKIEIVAQGLRRVRFMAVSPDHRIFVTDMYDRSDNKLGKIYILDGWNAETHTYDRITTYLSHLRNPNNLAFYTEPAREGESPQSWIYVPLTDRLVRYRYNPGDNAPSGSPEVLATYPDYGLNYKYGGWHLTRTIAFASLHGKTQLYVSVGSSCNACTEKEAIRASLSVMDPDGKNQRIIAEGLRNAVGLRYFPRLEGGSLFATNMGADHLGPHAPEDTFFDLDSNQHPGAITSQPGLKILPNGAAASDDQAPANYGWPTCYFENGLPHSDPAVSAPKPTDHIFPPPPAGPPPRQFDCSKIPAAYTTFAPHSSPLGLEYFDLDDSNLNGTFLVALHGAGHPSIGTGYRVVQFSNSDRKPKDFITGFLDQGKVKGRPCDILRIDRDTFLLTDDLDGVIYLIHP